MRHFKPGLIKFDLNIMFDSWRERTLEFAVPGELDKLGQAVRRSKNET